MAKSKINMKLYPMYKALSWDLLFYYAIIFLFLTQVKHFTASEVLIADACYLFFHSFVQLFCILIIDKIGKKNSLVLGNAIVAISILVIIFSQNIGHLIISRFILALGYSFKTICETGVLYNSIPKTKAKGKIFARIDSKGSAIWYFLDAVTSIVAGYLYIVNPYYPLIFCIVCLILSVFLCLGFEESNEKVSELEEISFKNYIKNIRYTFRFILKSNRLRALLIFAVLFFSILNISATLRTSLMTDLNVPAQYFGIIAAVYQIIASISSTLQNWFQKKFGNRVLAFFSIGMCLMFISAGLLGLINENIYTIIAILVIFTMHYISKGPYHTLMDKYLNSFSGQEISNQIFSARLFLISIFAPIVLLLTSFIMNYLNTAYTLIIIGGILLFIFLAVLHYMESRVGLKPEEYDKSDIEYVKVK